MKWAIFGAVVAVAFLAWGHVSGWKSAAPGSVMLDADIVYGSGEVGGPGGGRKTLRMDLYRPSERKVGETWPAILLIHGGGFSRGSKDGTIAVLARSLAERGIVAAAINYRLIPDDPPGPEADPRRRALAAAREDAAKALNWLRQNAVRYRIDPERLAVGGSSAGAITALFLAYSKPAPPLPVKAVVNLWGGLYGEEDLIQNGDPPLMIVHGTRDYTVPFRLAEALKARCDQVGLDCEYWPVAGGGHGFAAIPPDFELEGVTLADRVAAFLHERLAPRNQSSKSSAASR